MVLAIIMLLLIIIWAIFILTYDQLTSYKIKEIYRKITIIIGVLFIMCGLFVVLYRYIGHFDVKKEIVMVTCTLDNSDKIIITNNDEDSDYLNISEESVNKENIIDFFVSRNLSDYSYNKDGSDFLLKIRDENGAPKGILTFTEEIIEYKDILPEEVYNELLQKKDSVLEDIKTKKILQAKEIKEVSYLVSDKFNLVDYYFDILEVTY